MRFDYDDVFGDDYLHFYAPLLDDEQAERDTADIVAFLGLEPGARVLDAPCGHGRISRRLAARGIDVVGVDASEQFIDRARREAPTLDHRVGDLRALPVDGPFDAALSWFTSFGYFDDEGNRTVLAEYHRVLRPGGRLLIEMHNHDEIVRRFTPAPFAHALEVGDDVLLDASTFNCVTGRMETDRTSVRAGVVRRYHFSVRVPTIPELDAWLREAGFRATEFRARDGQPPAIDRPRLVAIATR